MNEKFYGIYFDRSELKVDEQGDLENPEALYVIEFEFDGISEQPVRIRRIGRNGAFIENQPDLSGLETVGYDDDESVMEALNRFYNWLEENIIFEELYPETRWQPAEYVCVGIDGCL